MSCGRRDSPVWKPLSAVIGMRSVRNWWRARSSRRSRSSIAWLTRSWGASALTSIAPQALEIAAGRGRAPLEVDRRDRLQPVVVAVVARARGEGRVLALLGLPGVLEQGVEAGLGLGVFRVQAGDRDGEGEEQRAERGVRDSGGRGHDRGG